jgi:hypothetical protein
MRARNQTGALSKMAYSHGMLCKIAGWLQAGAIPPLKSGDRVVDLGSQMINAGTPHADVAAFIRQFKPSFDERELSNRFPRHEAYYCYAKEVWELAGFNYLSLDVTEAPGSRVFDLNFGEVPPEDKGSAQLVINLGTTEHVANQLNCFRAVHDLMAVGGIAIHSVPFAGMLNHGLINYHPKFFFSLIVNNRYRLRSVDVSPPSTHAALGIGNTIFDGDRPHANLPGADEWYQTTMASGVITLVIERQGDEIFVPPVDFASGYFGDFPSGDLARLMNEIPHNAWADAYKRGVTPSQATSIVGKAQ